MRSAASVPRGPTGLRRRLVRAVVVAVARTAALGILIAGLASIQVAQQVERIGSQDRADHAPAHLTALITRYQCSRLGLGERAVPRAAIIRHASGSVRVVSFARGWRLHERHPAALVAVCLRAPRAAPRD